VDGRLLLRVLLLERLHRGLLLLLLALHLALLLGCDDHAVLPHLLQHPFLGLLFDQFVLVLAKLVLRRGRRQSCGTTGPREACGRARLGNTPLAYQMLLRIRIALLALHEQLQVVALEVLQRTAPAAKDYQAHGPMGRRATEHARLRMPSTASMIGKGQVARRMSERGGAALRPAAGQAASGLLWEEYKS
jgi:hypothetical protein